MLARGLEPHPLPFLLAAKSFVSLTAPTAFTPCRTVRAHTIVCFVTHNGTAVERSRRQRSTSERCCGERPASPRRLRWPWRAGRTQRKSVPGVACWPSTWGLSTSSSGTCTNKEILWSGTAGKGAACCRQTSKSALSGCALPLPPGKGKLAENERTRIPRPAAYASSSCR